MNGTRIDRYCPKCGVVVAPFDPEHVPHGNEVYHRSCWSKVQRSSQPAPPPLQGAPPYQGRKEVIQPSVVLQ